MSSTQKVHLLVYGCYMLACIPILITQPTNSVWWLWALLSIIFSFIQNLINLDDMCVDRSSDKCAQSIYLIGLPFSLITPILIAYYGIALGNKGKFDHTMLPALQNTTEQWCYTACPETNNFTSTCAFFNAIMYNSSQNSQFAICFDRATEICLSGIAVIANQCASQWNELLDAFENNDSNTSHDLFIISNLMEALLLTIPTGLSAYLIVSAIVYCITRQHTSQPTNGVIELELP